MAIVITDLSTVYDEFLDKGLAELKQLQKDTEMEDEQLASAASNVIIGAMQNSVGALETLKRVELLELQKDTEAKKALDIVSTTAVRDAQSEQDLLNKASEKARIDEQTALITKQVDSETNKALDIASSTAVRDAQSAKDLLVKDEQIAMSQVQQAKSTADTAFVTEQKTQLGYSVIYNNRLKTLKNYSDTLSNIGLGGFVIPSSMWSTYFNMANDCYINWGDIPVNKTFAVASTYPTTKA